MKHNWKLIYDAEPNGHRLFLDNQSGRYSICDQSGDTPDETDDGPLWISDLRPITYGEGCYYLPVIVTETGNWSKVPISARFADYLNNHHGIARNMDGVLVGGTRPNTILSPNGARIIGIKQLMPVITLIHDLEMATDVEPKEPGGVFTYTWGETDTSSYAGESENLERDGWTVYVDEEGGEFTEPEILEAMAKRQAEAGTTKQEPPAQETYECPNCGIVHDIVPIATLFEKSLVGHLFERVAPGEPMPYGECCKCGMLVHKPYPTLAERKPVTMRRECCWCGETHTFSEPFILMCEECFKYEESR